MKKLFGLACIVFLGCGSLMEPGTNPPRTFSPTEEYCYETMTHNLRCFRSQNRCQREEQNNDAISLSPCRRMVTVRENNRTVEW